MRPVAASGPGESASGDRRLRFGSLDFALHFGGVPMLALERASTEDQIAICDQIVLEVTQVLSERLGWETDRVAESLGIYLRDALRVPVQGSVRGVCRDPKDDRVFECALGAGARIIVSGDKDLRSVRSYLGIMVVTPRDYVTGAEK